MENGSSLRIEPPAKRSGAPARPRPAIRSEIDYCELLLLKWMVGFNLAPALGVLFMVLKH